MIVLLPVVAAGQANGDVEAAGGVGGGVHRAIVDAGDRGHQGEAETETVVAGAFVEARERQEQPIDLIGWYDRTGVTGLAPGTRCCRCWSRS